MLRGNANSPPRSRTVILAGAFPPPVHGFANAMLAVHDLLHARGHRTLKLVTSSGSSRSAPVAVPLMLWGLVKGIAIILVNAPRRSIYYLGISGGIRQVSDAILILVARLSRMPFVIHHHSFAYLNAPTLLTHLCLFLAGKNTAHVVLCECMAQSLRDEYQVKGNVFVISNAALMELPPPSLLTKSANDEINVGFLGAVTAAKGADNVLEVAQELGPRGGFRFTIAGSRPGPGLLDRMESLGSTTNYFFYLGPRYGTQKDTFLSSLDVLLFPTKYVNEAEPLVILEALSHGVVVITNQRGCLGEFAGSEYVIVVPVALDFEAVAIQTLVDWRNDAADLGRRSSAATQGFASIRSKSRTVLSDLFDLIETL